MINQLWTLTETDRVGDTGGSPPSVAKTMNFNLAPLFSSTVHATSGVLRMYGAPGRSCRVRSFGRVIPRALIERSWKKYGLGVSARIGSQSQSKQYHSLAPVPLEWRHPEIRLAEASSVGCHALDEPVDRADELITRLILMSLHQPVLVSLSTLFGNRV